MQRVNGRSPADVSTSSMGGSGLRESVLRLGEGEPERGLDELVRVVLREVDARAVALAHDADDLLEELDEVAVAGQRDVEDGDLLLELGRDDERRGEEEDRREGGFERRRELPHGADDGGVLEVGMEVLQGDERRLGDLLDRGDRLERLARALGRGLRPRAADPAEALRHGPAEERLAVGLGELAQDRLEPLLLRGDEVDERVPGADEDVELLHELRRRRARRVGGGRGAGGCHGPECSSLDAAGPVGQDLAPPSRAWAGVRSPQLPQDPREPLAERAPAAYRRRQPDGILSDAPKRRVERERAQ